MAYKIAGRIVELGAVQTSTSAKGTPYTRRDLIIAVRKFDSYTGEPTEEPDNTPKFTFFGDRCQQLDSFAAGQNVIVHFEVSGRRYERNGETNIYNELRPVRVEADNTASRSSGQDTTHDTMAAYRNPAFPQPFGQSVPSLTAGVPNQDAGNDDLPF